MLRLHFDVTEERVKLDTAKENDTPAAGNINYVECSFALPPAYDDFIVEAVFNGEKRALVDGVCSAPHIAAGECTVGVIAYTLENDAYKLLSSPRPCTICLPKGSFDHIRTVSTQPAPGALEEYYQRIKDLIKTLGGAGDDKPYSKLKDIVVIKTVEEYDSFFGNEEYITSLIESMQEGDYILMFILDCDMGDGERLTAISTIVMENGDIAFYDGFSTEVINEKIKSAVKPIENKLNAVTPVVINGEDRVIELVHNQEYRNPEPDFLGYHGMQLQLPSAIPVDYISSLVFNSGNEPTVLSYPQTILFTGDDVVDYVLVPKANTTYNVMFWYDGININAVSRGVPYAQE